LPSPSKTGIAGDKDDDDEGGEDEDDKDDKEEGGDEEDELATLKYSVAMTCGGCERAVNSVLTKTVGVSKVSIDLPRKEVVVEGTATRDEVEAALKKTGKAYQLIE